MSKPLGSTAHEQLITLGIALFFLVIFVGSFQYHPMSRLFPSIVSGAGLLICILHLYLVRRGGGPPSEVPIEAMSLDDPPPTRGEIARGLLLVAAGTISFILLGFWITSIGLIFIVPRLMGWRASPLVLLAVAVITAGGIALMFNVVLKSPMPNGVVVNRLADALRPVDSE